MKTTFDLVNINYSEYSFFTELENLEKINFLFEIYESQLVASKGIDLSSFFVSIQEQLDTTQDSDIDSEHDDKDHVDVMVDDKNILIESNSLKAVKMVTNKFMEAGYILRRDKETEKMFKRDKLTRYLRVFNILSYSTGICYN